jgi:hypothetical protein
MGVLIAYIHTDMIALLWEQSYNVIQISAAFKYLP